MIKLSDKPNTEAPGPAFNYGRIKDDSGVGDGTPVNVLVYSDLHLFFEKLMEAGGVVANGLPDSDDDGYQLYQAFQRAARREMKPLLGVLTESMIGDPSSTISPIAPYAMLGLVWTSPTVLIPGYVFYNQELFFCGGFSGTISDTAVFTKTGDNILQVTDAVSGSGDFDYADLLFYQATAVMNPNKVITKVIPIGVWNMDSTAGKNITHGLPDVTKIINVQASIISDNSALVTFLTTNADNTTASIDGAMFADATFIQLYRIAGGYYDQTAYDTAGSFNRGYVTIQYFE